MDVNENRKAELVTCLSSAIESVSFKKEKIASTQIPVDRKNDECLETLRDEKNKTLDMVRDKYDSMIRQATNQKEEARREMTSLEENLTLLNNVKVHVDEETLTPRDVKNYQETLDSIKQHTEQIPSEPRVNVYMELTYTPFRNKEWLLGQLCGKLQPRNHSADGQTQNLLGMPVQQPSAAFSFGKQQPLTFQPPVFSVGTATGFALGGPAQQPYAFPPRVSSATGFAIVGPAQQPSASGGFTLGTPKEQGARAVNETTQPTSLMETEEASASTSPPTDHVLPKFERKFSLILRFWVLVVGDRTQFNCLG